MASFMGRAGSGSGAASRALDPLRSRLRPSGSQRTYLSISHLRSLHIELVSLLYSAGATSAAPTAASPDPPSLSARQSRRLVEILRAIAELVREREGENESFSNAHDIQTREERGRVAVLRRGLRPIANLPPAVEFGTVGACTGHGAVLCREAEIRLPANTASRSQQPPLFSRCERHFAEPRRADARAKTRRIFCTNLQIPTMASPAIK